MPTGLWRVFCIEEVRTGMVMVEKIEAKAHHWQWNRAAKVVDRRWRRWSLFRHMVKETQNQKRGKVDREVEHSMVREDMRGTHQHDG